MARILVLFSSLFGANAQLAGLASEALSAAGAEVRMRRVAEVALPGDVQTAAEGAAVADTADLEWADGFVFSSPAHTGLLSASMKAFIDQHHDAAVAGRFLDTTFTAMATSGFAHAGQERVVDDLNAAAAAWGCVIVPPSTANPVINKLNGNPYGLSFVLEHGKLADAALAEEAISAHLARFAAVTAAIAAGRAPSPASSIRKPPPTAAEVFS
ncbi:flavodoxin family protein [Pseudoclavibacter helvolus]|uniref:flavodoxin family protein n=1 Tax=Pseudoclavibacter helvolus TaxID=255205 RepID=UPI003C75A519